MEQSLESKLLTDGYRQVSSERLRHECNGIARYDLRDARVYTRDLDIHDEQMSIALPSGERDGIRRVLRGEIALLNGSLRRFTLDAPLYEAVAPIYDAQKWRDAELSLHNALQLVHDYVSGQANGESGIREEQQASYAATK